MRVNRDTLSRTEKLEWDEGRARSPEEAEANAARYSLEVSVGAGVIESDTKQMMLLTIVNVAKRAFRGGVRVHLEADGVATVRWGLGLTLSEAVTHYGGEVVDSLSGACPLIRIGVGASPASGASIVLHPTWQGWSAGVVEGEDERLPESIEFPLCGVLAGALAVSEAFQNTVGYEPAGRRAVGISLWRPDADWRDPASFGEPLTMLPLSIWLLGLGHLGQASAWSIGSLPYRDTSEINLMLQDFDRVVVANESTGVLCDHQDVGERKTRAVARRLELLGFSTSITERRFDEATRVSAGEPRIGLAGFDDLAPRRLLEEASFDLVVDVGIGGGRQSYLAIDVHAFPASERADEVFPAARAPREIAGPQGEAYAALADELREKTGLDEGAIQCGLLEIAGVSIGAAFVGCVAAPLALAEILRLLAGGMRCEYQSLTLRSPHLLEVIENTSPGPLVNPGFVSI